jgi:endonuclease YncB( thermonuclease family)
LTSIVLLAAAAILAALLARFEPAAPALTGHASAVDGDTLRLGSQRIRLIGIDAPERDQFCTRDGAQWPCGEEARRSLAALTGQGEVRCAPDGHDRYGRTLAHCSIFGRDLGERMVSDGWAVADLEYKPAELGASVARRGIWAGSFERPSDWRRDGGSSGPWWLQWLKDWLG